MKISEVKKCCFCVPIRKGVLAFGYSNLVLCLLSLPLLVLLLVAKENVAKEMEKEIGMFGDLHLRLPLTITFVIADIIVVIILLVGAHKKKRNLLQIYFYSGVVLQVLTLVVDLIYFDYTDYVLNIVYIILLGFNIYQLFLVYNLAHFMKENRNVQYIPHVENRAVV